MAIVPDHDAWPAIQALRLAHDQQVHVWPPHINLLYPFVHEVAFPDAARRLGEAVRNLKPLRLRFTEKGNFARVVYLAPICDEDPGLARLHSACKACFPGLPQFHDFFTPHLTIGQFQCDEERQALLQSPFEAVDTTVRSLCLLAREPGQPFRVVLRISLGGGLELGDGKLYTAVPPPLQTSSESLAHLDNGRDLPAVLEPDGLFSNIADDGQDTQPGDVASVLGDMLGQGGVAFVDNSGSTSGSILTCMKDFVAGLAPRQTALWNSTCEPLVDTARVSWRSTGGTCPSSIYRHYGEVPSWWSSFTLLTDGQVPAGEVTSLSKHAHKTSHLPTILGIAQVNGNRLISSCNVSVLYSHFTVARTAVLVVMNVLNEVRVIKAKGDWEKEFGVLPELTDTAMLHDFPKVDIQTIKSLGARRCAQQPRGTILVGGCDGGTRWLHLDQLLSVQDAAILAGQVTEAEMEDIARAFHGQGRLAEFRQWLVAMSASMQVEAQQAVERATAACVGENNGGHSLQDVLAQLRQTRDPTQREVLRSKLFALAGEKADVEAETAAVLKRDKKGVRQLLDAALRVACALEKAGMSADVLGRLSNRAMRAKKIELRTLSPMAELDMSGAPVSECNVMLETGPAALFLRRVPAVEVDHNTTDFALDFPLVVGCSQRNDIFCPDVVGLASGTADAIEATQQSVLGREDTVVAIPIVSLTSQKNRKELFLRLCLAFNNGLALEAVWQVALASILHTLETKPWAAHGTAVGEMLQYFGAQIMSNVVLRKGARLAMDEDKTVGVALTDAIRTRDLAQDYPLEGTVTAAAALLRWCVPVQVPASACVACITARAHRAVPQQYRNWMASGDPDGLPCSTAALWQSIFRVRHGAAGELAAVAGTHQLPTSWEGLLTEESRLSLDRFVRVLASSVDDSSMTRVAGADALVRPGLALVVRGTLAKITNHHISPSRAVELAQGFHNAVAAELNLETVGTTTYDDAHAILADWLAWARCPMRPLAPFVTPYGPSLLFFYHGRTFDGAVTNMAQGFRWNIDCENTKESDENRMTRLAEHVRQVRGELLQREYQFNVDGTYNKFTTSAPIHRCMSDEWGESAAADPSHGSFVSAVVHRLVRRSTGNVHHEFLEHAVAMLCPSLLQAGRPTAAGDFHEMRPLAARLRLELAGRTTAEVQAEDAPPAIWVPRDCPELQTRLREAQEATNACLAKARATLAARKVTSSELGKGQPVKKLMGEALGRKITKVLRHLAQKLGLAVRSDGYVEVENLLTLDAFAGVKVDELLEVSVEAELTQKKRHQVIEEDGVLLIRAVQGHSMACVKAEDLLEPIHDAAEVPICIHGTYEKAFAKIKESELDRMGRNEIQMATGLPDDLEVTSGVRSNAEVLIYIDVARAMSQGLRFFRSPNNVICTPGPIPPSCFAHVCRRSDGVPLMSPAFAVRHQADGRAPPQQGTPLVSMQEDGLGRGA